MQALYFYQTAFGFKLMGYKYNDEGIQDQTSFLLEQNNVHIILTSATTHGSLVANYIHYHGDSISDIAFEVEDIESVFIRAIKNGAKLIQEPVEVYDKNGKIKKASISTFGDTIHTFIERYDHSSYFLPNFITSENTTPFTPTGLQDIDHLAIAIEENHLTHWGEFYKKIFNFHESHREKVITKLSGMDSLVMNSEDNTIKFVFVEPINGTHKSQIADFLFHHNGAGVQHLAFLTDDICQSVRKLRQNGVQFLQIPDNYYDNLLNRLINMDENLADLRGLQILADRDDKGYLLQVFTKPINTRPTLFFEIIQRKKAEGFGKGNIEALFLAKEQEQLNKISKA